MPSKDQIFADPGFSKVAVETRWGTLFVRTMSSDERDAWEVRCMSFDQSKPDSFKGTRAFLVALTTCDEAGNAIFTLDDLGKIGSLSAVEIDKLYAATQKLNKLTKEDLEELEKKPTQQLVGDVPAATAS